MELKPFHFFDKKNRAITLRSPQVGEGEAILHVVREILATSEHLLTQADELNLTAQQEDELIAQHLQREDTIMIVPVADGRIIGMMDFRPGSRKRNAHAGEFGMSLLRDYRGCGIGRAMIEQLLLWARQHPRIERVGLRVHSDNSQAISLYQTCGFEIEGREKRAIKLSDGVYCDVLTMAQFVI